MIKTTIGTVVSARNVLAQLSEQTLPIKQSYMLAKLIKVADEELKIYHGERIKLCEKYGKLSNDGKKYDITDPEGFGGEYNELTAQEISFDLDPVRIDGVLISANDILKVEPFITITEVKNE